MTHESPCNKFKGRGHLHIILVRSDRRNHLGLTGNHELLGSYGVTLDYDTSSYLKATKFNKHSYSSIFISATS